MSVKRPFNKDLLNNAVTEHIKYEIDMLRNTCKKTSDIWEIKNALIEAFAIHFVCILDFLYNDKPRPDDISYIDYVRNQDEWLKKRPQKTALLEKSEIRRHKEVAHLTSQRISGTPLDKSWEQTEIYNDLMTVFNVFLECTDNPLLKKTFKISDVV